MRRLRISLRDTFVDQRVLAKALNFVNYFFVAINREVIALRHDVYLRHTEALGCAGALAFGPSSLLPASEHIMKVVFRLFVLSLEPSAGHCPNFSSGNSGVRLVIQPPSICIAVVEPHVVRSVGLYEQVPGPDVADNIALHAR